MLTSSLQYIKKNQKCVLKSAIAYTDFMQFSMCVSVHVCVHVCVCACVVCVCVHVCVCSDPMLFDISRTSMHFKSQP